MRYYKGRPVKVSSSRTGELSVPVRALPSGLIQDAEVEATKRGMLAGDLIAEMTKAIGIQPCGRCDARRKWVNAAHAWLRGEDWRKEL